MTEKDQNVLTFFVLSKYNNEIQRENSRVLRGNMSRIKAFISLSCLLEKKYIKVLIILREHAMPRRRKNMES